LLEDVPQGDQFSGFWKQFSYLLWHRSP